MDGLLVVDKPSGPTSHDVVARMRRVLGEKRIGHTGTLDPMATGVLLLVVGKATRLATFLSGSDKNYDAVVRFGFATDTADAQGQQVGPVTKQPMPSREAIDAALDQFRGTFMQQPPAFSAKKIGGQRSYQLARAARTSHPAPFAPLDASDLPAPRGPLDPPALPVPCRVTASRLQIVAMEGDCVTLSVACSAGFYIRSLAHDLGERLGVGAHLTALRRTRTGEFGLDRAVTLDAAERDPLRTAAALVPLADMLPNLPAVILTADGLRRVTHGQDIRPSDQVSSLNAQLSANCPEPSALSPQPFAWSPQPCARSPQPSASSPQPFMRLLNGLGELVAIGEPSPDGVLHPSVVLV